MDSSRAANCQQHFYPRSPCGERPDTITGAATALYISIHALLAESDRSIGCRGRPHQISIHALLAESDRPWRDTSPPRQYFYPRSPCGERLLVGHGLSLLSVFLSTLSLRRATCHNCVHRTTCCISIHALLAESDQCLLCAMTQPFNFYPRSPCGERLALGKVQGQVIVISIHALLAESDLCEFSRNNGKIKFLSTLSLRRATAPNRRLCPRSKISIHALLAESDPIREALN